MKAVEIRQVLRGMADPRIAASASWFFKTGEGQYGEGDRFLGVKVPVLREIVRRNKDVTEPEALKLLKSEFHEERAIALMFMVRLFEKGTAEAKDRIFRKYLESRRWINNWDLVDCSAPRIVGSYLFGRDRTILYQFAKSKSLWERRIAIIATQYFIRQNDYSDTLNIAALLLGDREDLIHKAAGWMLREVANRNVGATRAFLRQHAPDMPRTMLRYTIEKFPEDERRSWLAVKPALRK